VFLPKIFSLRRGNQPFSFEKRIIKKEKKNGLVSEPEKPKGPKNGVFLIFLTGENEYGSAGIRTRVRSSGGFCDIQATLQTLDQGS
jgi:hypothetical protein